MNSQKNKWILITITILLIGTITNGVLLLEQSAQLEDSQANITSLEEQLSSATGKISSLENNILALTDLSAGVSTLETDVSALTTDVSALKASTEKLSTPSLAEANIADIVAMLKPAIVCVDTEVVLYSFGRAITQQGAGSGWIIDASGIIVTNYHVVEGARTITVTLDDGRKFTVNPNTVAADSLNDLAILKIDAQNLPAVAVGDSSDLRVGDWVVTMGNALGLGTSAKEGIISRLDISLTLDSQKIGGLIETSAAINPGNSGGPLINMNGEVIGITNAKIASIGVEGMGYAISMNKALPIIQGLIMSQ